MSKHLWLIKKFSPTTIAEARKLWDLVIRQCLDYRRACQTVGYILESLRQSGAGSYGFDRETGQFVKGKWRKIAEGKWQHFCETFPSPKSRFTTGKNAENYFQVGERLLGRLAVGYGFDPGMPASILFDYLTEREAESAAS